MTNLVSWIGEPNTELGSFLPFLIDLPFSMKTNPKGVLYNGKVTSEHGNLQVTFPRTRPLEVVPRQPVGIEYVWDEVKIIRQSDVFDTH